MKNRIKNVISLLIVLSMLVGYFAIIPAEDNNGIIVQAADQKACHYLDELPIVESDRYTGNEGDSFVYPIGKHQYSRGNTDINNNSYTHGIECWIARWNYTKESSWAYSVFDLNKSYNSIEGKCVIIKSANTDNFDMSLDFYGDNTLIATYTLKPDNIPFDISLNVKNVKLLKIYAHDNVEKERGTSIGLVDMRLDGYELPTSTDGYYHFDNHTYKFFEEVVDWHTAKKYCENIGGHLATITSSEEQYFIESLLPESHEYYWLGGSDEDDEGNFTWITGEPFIYTNWCVNNPNVGGTEDYLGMMARRVYFDGSYQERGWWNDFGEGSGSTDGGYICEWDFWFTDPDNQVKSIEISQYPKKMIYEKGEGFDRTGMVLRVTYEDGTKKETNKGYIINGDKFNNVGGQDVIVSFGGKEIKLRVAVNGIIDVSYRSDGKNSLISKNKYKDASHPFYYSDSLFYYNNTSYHNDLAVISLGMEMASFTSHDTDDNYTKKYTTDSNGYCDRAKNIKKYYDDLGFENVRFYNYDKSLGDSSDKVAYSFASKPITNGVGTDTLVTVVVRGGGYGAEWASNFNVGNTGNHAGFQTAADQVYQSLVQYIKDIKANTEGEIKLWVTGYSRGAAVGNLTTHMVNNNHLVKSTNVYAYLFATPKGYYGSPSSTDDNNIFNIISSNDLIPKLACEQWGFTTCGQNMILPNYQPQEVKHSFEALIGETFNVEDNYAIENSIIDSLVTIAPDRNAFFKDCQKNVVGQFAKKFKKKNGNLISCLLNGINKSDVNKQLGLGYLISDVILQDIDTSDDHTLGDFIHSAAENSKNNIARLMTISFAHYPEHYLSWLETGGFYEIADESTDTFFYPYCCESDKLKIEDSIKSQFNMFYTLNKVSCPVDVKVYDSNNNLVVSIVNNKVEVEKLPCCVDGETKYFYSYGDNYRVVLTGNGTGTMDYQVQEFNNESEIVRTVNHYDLSLTKGKQYTGQIKNTILDKTNTYALTTNSNALKPAYDSMTPVGSKHKITIVNGASIIQFAYQNECVEIIAEEKEGKYFSHWTSDVGDGIFNDPKSEATNFVMPNKDVKISAVYVDSTILGDLNNDGIVNAKDNAILAAAFGKRKGNSGYNEAADFNNDSIINAKDKAIISQNFGKRK